MDNKKIIIIFSIVSAVLLLTTGILIGRLSSKKTFEEQHSNEVDKNEIKSDEKTNTPDNDDDINNNDSNKETTTNNKDIPKKEESTSLSSKDNLVISELNSSLNNINKNANDKDFSKKAKATFISIVDFLFYDGTIKGVTFNELTEKGKTEVLKLANKIDTTLEEKSPGYKETISATTSKAYKKASQIIKDSANDINNFAKESLGDENYNSIIEAKDELLLYSKNALNFITGNGSKILNDTKNKLNDWYQDFKNK